MLSIRNVVKVSGIVLRSPPSIIKRLDWFEIMKGSKGTLQMYFYKIREYVIRSIFNKLNVIIYFLWLPSFQGVWAMNFLNSCQNSGTEVCEE